MSQDIFGDSDHILMSDELTSMMPKDQKRKPSVIVDDINKFEIFHLTKKTDDVNFLCEVTFKCSSGQETIWESKKFHTDIDDKDFHVMTTSIDFVLGTATLVGTRPIVSTEVRVNGK